MRILGTFAVGVALLSTTALTQAQTVTRQVTRESVETVITQGPNGTAVTRRILTPEPGVTYVAPPPEYPPVAVPAYEPGPAYEQTYVEPVPLAPRRVIAAAPERTRTTRRVTTATRPVTRATRTETVTRTVAAPPVYDNTPVLSPAQRQIIYRAVVPVPPRPVVADLYAPRAIYPADDDYYRAPDPRDYAYDAGYDSGNRAVPYRDPYHPEYRQSVALVVGARIPQSVPLLAVPEPVLARIPAARPYSYARLDDRVYLVDPATGIIAADITP
jgi:hypothetical protein